MAHLGLLDKTTISGMFEGKERRSCSDDCCAYCGVTTGDPRRATRAVPSMLRRVWEASVPERWTTAVDGL